MEYYSALKKKEILSFVTTWMNLRDIMPTQPDFNPWYLDILVDTH